MADDKTKLEGQRAAIREHKEKYERYSIQNDKDFALKTIKNCQNQIANILRRHPHWSSSWEDSWKP